MSTRSASGVKVPSLKDVEPKCSSSSKQGLADLGRLYFELRSSLLRYASRYFKRSQEAEDVVQDVFVNVIEAQREREIHAPKAYLYRATRNLSLKKLGKQSYKLTDLMTEILPDAEITETRTLEEEFQSHQNFELFCRAVGDLPPKCQRAFVLCRIYGYSYREIAEEMNIGLKAVEGHLARATRRCMDFMDEQDGRGSSQKRGKRHG
ncbi:sigma-70 family RNA polymerase sigma factor [Pseudomaricurvus alkylphenolicus]|uniref:RNA polymerase sigma factor n=1 Tax=Pseudomaricurvus alkylphenolicus TaxID=1306991 RepID=UPI00141E44A5|nr:sigma-70 family RNA polymerase sigma factor [Pseudomaricurvus alkylphenolicus]NIB43446.1 sigma-70 family RNA polymerase sigma factor [Pseudomaricurvus alkylphenolicus]